MNWLDFGLRMHSITERLSPAAAIAHRLRRIWDPALYHGYGKKRHFFEGWYYKLISADGKSRFAVIPGIALGDAKETPHAFIQVLDGMARASHYIRFDAGEFSFNDHRFEVCIGKNRFTRDGIRCDVSNGAYRFSADVSFSGCVPWPVTLLSPGIMGPYAFAPFMECYHGVLSFDHLISGTIMNNKKKMSMNGGRGYIEKDWGRSFPSAWVWMQTNHFTRERVSLTASVANIPWMGGSFTGFIAGLYLGGKLYRFASYTGARLVSIVPEKRSVRYVLADRKRTLSLTAYRAPGANLASPSHGVMEGRIAESMSARIAVTLTENGRTVFKDEGVHAGLEISGNIGNIDHQ
ncbi:MAG: tocopherol cyclase family protein [Spirochaetota bacterium]